MCPRSQLLEVNKWFSLLIPLPPIDTNQVSVNGSVAEVTKLLSAGDVVRIKFNTRAAHESIYGREQLTVLYEDEELAVVVKPSGKTMVAFGYMLPFSLRPSSIQMARSDDTEEMDDLPDAEEEEDDDEENEFHIQQNVSPTVGQQRIPCATHGLEKASNGLVSNNTSLLNTFWCLRSSF